MERRGQIYEIIIKLTFAIFSFVAAIFTVKNVISMFPLLKAYSYDELQMYDVIYDTHIGSIFFSIGIVDEINSSTIISAFASFLLNIEWICVVFLFITLVMLILNFMFIKWQLVRTYVHLSFYLILSYLFKYILFALCFLIFYKDDLASVSLSLISGTIVYFGVSLVQIILYSMFIIKFIFNIQSDIKNLISLRLTH